MVSPSWSRPWSWARIAVLALLAPSTGAAAPALDRPVSEVEAPTGEATPPQPSPPPTEATAPAETTPTDTPASAPATPTSSGDAETLLGPSEGSPTPTTPRPATPPSPDDDEAVSDFYRQLYRPRSNPGRFTAVPRITYTLLGSGDGTIAGRMAGFTADLGQSWNTIGYALTLTANVGDLSLRADDKLKSFAMIGGGPSVNLGRLALLQRGFLDLRVGYDFFYAPARSFDTSVIAQSIAPHGPRLQLNMGLILHPGKSKRTFQGIGLTVGYQGLVGSLIGGPMPYTSVLMFGASYWIG